MNRLLKSVITIFFIINAIFWGLASHAQHCSIADKLIPGKPCPPHWIHLLIGIISFIIAVSIQQWEYIQYIIQEDVRQ